MIRESSTTQKQQVEHKKITKVHFCRYLRARCLYILGSIYQLASVTEAFFLWQKLCLWQIFLLWRHFFQWLNCVSLTETRKKVVSVKETCFCYINFFYEGNWLQCLCNNKLFSWQKYFFWDFIHDFQGEVFVRIGIFWYLGSQR